MSIQYIALLRKLCPDMPKLMPYSPEPPIYPSRFVQIKLIPPNGKDIPKPPQSVSNCNPATLKNKSSDALHSGEVFHVNRYVIYCPRQHSSQDYSDTETRIWHLVRIPGRSFQGRPREKLLSGIPCLSCNHNLTLWKRKIVDYSTGYSGSTSPPGGEGRIVASVWYQTPSLTSPKAQRPCPDGSGLCEPFNIIALYYIIVD